MTASSGEGVGQGAVERVFLNNLQNQVNNINNIPTAKYSTMTVEELSFEGSYQPAAEVEIFLKNESGENTFNSCMLVFNSIDLTGEFGVPLKAVIGTSKSFITNYGAENDFHDTVFFWSNLVAAPSVDTEQVLDEAASICFLPTVSASTNTRLAFRVFSCQGNPEIEGVKLKVTFPDGSYLVSDEFIIGAGAGDN